jgi:hypothetical protein
MEMGIVKIQVVVHAAGTSGDGLAAVVEDVVECPDLVALLPPAVREPLEARLRAKLEDALGKRAANRAAFQRTVGGER